MLLLIACAAPTSSDPLDLTVELEPPSDGYQVVTEPFTVEAFAEREICSVVWLEPVADEILLWTDTLETLVSADTHHMNIYVGPFSFLDPFLGEGASEEALGVPVGQYDCDELDVMETAYPLFPSQRESQRITLPEGVAMPLMAPTLMIFSHHYVNTSDTPVRINAALNVEAVPSAEVEQTATLLFDTQADFEVAPQTSAVVHQTCVVDRDVSVALVSTHTHETGECAALSTYDGAEVAPEPFFVNRNWEAPPILHFEPGTFELSAGEGIHYACHFENDTDGVLVDDGTADGEMCIFAAVVYPGTMTVEDVEETVANGDILGLSGLLADAMGSCPEHVEATTPWTEGSTCDDYEQTESNTLR